jgi:hypothetical protein
LSSPAEGFQEENTPKILTKNAIKICVRKENGRMIHFRLFAVCNKAELIYKKNLSQFNTKLGKAIERDTTVSSASQIGPCFPFDTSHLFFRAELFHLAKPNGLSLIFNFFIVICIWRAFLFFFKFECIT